ncbi:MAG TPA: DedA family protein [Candidatus Saccharimonadales bacterium]|nr:DedA family protein [Candidatus Saccharimonadales bacterium]
MLSHLSQIIIHFVQSSGYLAVFILMTLESMLIPIPSEITMPFAGFLAQQGHMSLVVVILVGAVANLVGSLIAYAIGYFLEESVVVTLIDKYGKYILLRKHEYERAMKWFQKYGNSVVFFSRLLPAVRTFISLPAGLAEMNIMKFSLYSFIGSLLWSSILTYIGFYLGKNWESIHGVFSKIQYIVIALLLAAIGYYIYTHIKKRKN